MPGMRRHGGDAVLRVPSEEDGRQVACATHKGDSEAKESMMKVAIVCAWWGLFLACLGGLAWMIGLIIRDTREIHRLRKAVDSAWRLLPEEEKLEALGMVAGIPFCDDDQEDSADYDRDDKAAII
jgi:hypothetical protein